MLFDLLAMEQAELDDVYRRLHGQPLVHDETAALNALATRCMSSSGPQVLSWGGWAEFGQRRLAAVIARYDSYLRHSLGSADAADTVKAKLHDQLGALWTFPASTIWWTKGPRGKEADDRYFSEAVTEALTHPQRATVRVWTLLDFAGPYTQMRRFIAPPQGWFVATAPRSAYEAAVRMEASGLRPVQDLEQLLKDAPYDVGLVYPYLIAKHGKTIPFDVLTTRFGERMRYDTRVIGTAIEAAGESDQGLDLLATACTVSQGYCSTLGYQLARRGRDAEAVKAYERLLNDEGVDSVSKANWSGWLVDYYQAQGRTGPALKLAEESAGTGAAAGLITAGRLYERLGRMDDAESSFRSSAERYDAPADLIAFYYRAVAVRKDAGYQPAWQRELERVFPNGLVEGAGPDGPPTTGVFIESDSAAARAVGLQAGDVIVAVDGWRVENMPQYRVVRAFPLAGGFTLTVARGPARLPVKVANSAFTPQFTIADYPVQGWIEK